MFRSRWSRPGPMTPDSPFATGGGGGVATMPAAMPAASRPSISLPVPTGPVATTFQGLVAQARSLIAAIQAKGANAGVSRNQSFASAGPNASREAQWTAYVRALQARLASL